MSVLTPAEQAAARAFRDAERAKLAERQQASPPDLYLSPLLHHVRHECTAKDGKSESFEFREVYLLDPSGRFAFVYREGRCADCRLTAGTQPLKTRLVDASERPPVGRISRVQ